MLTRLRVSGLKNLIDVDVRFGPFTCIAGPNGSGKSNLFDAITLLSSLTSDTLMNSAIRVRDDSGKASNVRNLFHKVGDRFDDEITFTADMLIPKDGVDDLGQTAKAATTSVQYKLTLRYRASESLIGGALELTHEELTHIKAREMVKSLRFPQSTEVWRQSVLGGKKTSSLISTSNDAIKLHQDGTMGMPRTFLKKNLPRTVLSTVNATESPTALLARREMQSWRLLQLEPSALRKPDEFRAAPEMGSNGSHLPAIVYHLGQTFDPNRDKRPATWAYDQLAFDLEELIDDVRGIKIDKDDKRELLTLLVQDKYGTYHPARALSDGTLRFLALAVLKLDPKVTGLICLEEPENGIHPERIQAMIQQLQNIAVDPNYPVDRDNPLRQVIVNTHSPVVVGLVPEQSLLVAHLKEVRKDGDKFKIATFEWLADTWRAKMDPQTPPIAPGTILAYLNPGALATTSDRTSKASKQKTPKERKVIERPEFQILMPLGGGH